MFPASCALTVGVCAGRTPVCDGAAWNCTFPDSYQSTETVCDGDDNDCDGSTDEGCLSVAPSTERRVDRGDGTGGGELHSRAGGRQWHRPSVRHVDGSSERSRGGLLLPIPGRRYRLGFPPSSRH